MLTRVTTYSVPKNTYTQPTPTTSTSVHPRGSKENTDPRSTRLFIGLSMKTILLPLDCKWCSWARGIDAIVRLTIFFSAQLTSKQALLLYYPIRFRAWLTQSRRITTWCVVTTMLLVVKRCCFLLFKSNMVTSRNGMHKALSPRNSDVETNQRLSKPFG